MPPKRRWASQDDPRLHTPEYLALRAWMGGEVRKQANRGGATYCEATRCLLPGVPIRVGGRRGPAHLDVGHIIPRQLDDRQIWTKHDVRPEHARCNRSAGNAITQAIKRSKKAAAQRPALTLSNDEW